MKVVNQLKELGLSPVKSMIGSTQEIFKKPYEEVEKLRGEVIADNFRYHYENNEFYRSVCKEKGITPDDIQGIDDLIKIPLIPVKTFKQPDSHVLMTAKLSEVEFEMRSTGTSGIPSVSRRDEFSMTTAVLACYAMYREFFRIFRGMALFLFPPTDEMPEMGMVKALNMFAGLLDGSTNLVKHVTFNPAEAVELLQKWEGKHTRHIVGPPFLVHRLLSYCIDNNIKLKLEKKSQIITLGGWKRYTGREIPRKEFDQLCFEYLGIQPSNVRDMYGLVEGNFLAIECREQEKHMPPWVHISMRNPKNVLEEVPVGERGVIAFFDPSSKGYPAFIITEDVGYLKPHTNCSCGRNGQMLVYISRLPGVEVGCCAINLEKFIEEKEEQERQKALAGGE